MTKPFLKVSISLTFVGIGVLSLLMLVPRTYDIPTFQPRAEVAYWELKTGSRIGYTFLPGKGKDSLPPLIYLHGGPGGMITPSIIELLRPLTTDGYDVYLYDQIGSGHSSRLEDIEAYTVSRHVEDLAAIADQIGTGKVILFGHSWGAMLAMEYLAAFPEHVDRIILSGPGPILPLDPTLRQLAPPDSLHLFSPPYSNAEANRQTRSLRSRFITYVAQAFGLKLASDAEADQFFSLLNGQLSRSTSCVDRPEVQYLSGLGYYAHIMTVADFGQVSDKRARLQDHPLPLLILKGQCDNQAWGYTQEYVSIFPHAYLEVMEGAGHAIEAGRHAEYQALIKAFLTP